GSQPKVIEDDPVPRLGRPMARDQPRPDRRLEGRRDERGGPADEPIEHDRDARDGRLDDDPDERSDLETADRGKDPDRIGRIGTVTGERSLDDRDLVPAAGLID